MASNQDIVTKLQSSIVTMSHRRLIESVVKRRALGILILCGCAAGLALLISCSSIDRAVVAPLDIPGASYAGNRPCYDCHTNITRMFPGSAHPRIHIESAPRTGQTGFESFHGPGTLH